MKHSEIAAGVLPRLELRKARPTQQASEFLRRILVRVFGMNALPGMKDAFRACDAHVLGGSGLEMHLNAASRLVVKGHVGKRRRIEVGTDQRIDVVEHIAVEGR